MTGSQLSHLYLGKVVESSDFDHYRLFRVQVLVYGTSSKSDTGECGRLIGVLQRSGFDLPRVLIGEHAKVGTVSASSAATEGGTSAQPSPTTPTGSVRQMRLAKRKEVEYASSPSKRHQPDHDASPTPTPTPTKASNRKGKGRAKQHAGDTEDGPSTSIGEHYSDGDVISVEDSDFSAVHGTHVDGLDTNPISLMSHTKHLHELPAPPATVSRPKKKEKTGKKKVKGTEEKLTKPCRGS
ncbi:hypothetical protein N7535_007899 [Penicillium sp. DV-2018c]|nr:hypothetical protein N7535_007899 [Penicillium sp. DV-2018c]